MTRKQVNAVLDELALLIERHVKKHAVGEFILAGLIKIHTVKRPAKKSYTGINPFTGQETVFKARPASVAVKVHALKGLKDMAQYKYISSRKFYNGCRFKKQSGCFNCHLKRI